MVFDPRLSEQTKQERQQEAERWADSGSSAITPASKRTTEELTTVPGDEQQLQELLSGLESVLAHPTSLAELLSLTIGLVLVLTRARLSDIESLTSPATPSSPGGHPASQERPTGGAAYRVPRRAKSKSKADAILT